MKQPLTSDFRFALDRLDSRGILGKTCHLQPPTKETTDLLTEVKLHTEPGRLMLSGTCTWTADLAPFTTDTDSLGTIAMGNRKRFCQFAQVKEVQEAVNKTKRKTAAC